MITLIYTTLYAIVFAIGACVGSFVAVVAYRVPKELGFVAGRSACPSCDHRLSPADLVPVLGWAALKGRCRYCGARISPRYPLVESACGAAGLLLYIHILPAQRAALYFAVFCILLAIALIDADTQTISDGMNIALGALAALSIWLGPEIPLADRFIGMAAGAGPLLAISLAVSGAFGLGDVFLMAAAGFLLGWQGALAALFIGIIIGGAYGACALALRRKKRKDHFAFGPCLAAGIFAALLFGDRIVGWYMGFL